MAQIQVSSGGMRTRHFSRGHLVPLDGMRGSLILAVMASHFFAVNFAGKSVPVRIVGQLLYYGWMGVDAFFVLSGFLITGILLDSREQTGYFKNFYMRRILRIFPLYYGVLLALVLFTPLLKVQWHGTLPALFLYLQNIQRFNAAASQMGPNVSLNHLWSLAIEEQFYFLWPLLVFVARTPRRVLAVALAGSGLALLFRICLLLRSHDGYTAHFNMFARSDALLMGAVLAILYRTEHWQTVLRWSPWVTGLFGGALLTTMIAPEPAVRPELWQDGFRYTVTAITSCGVLALALKSGWVSAFFSTRVLRFFGKYSYGLYILHMAFLPVLSRVFRAGLYSLYPSRGFAVSGSAAILTVLSCAAAYASFHLYEKHFLKLKRFFDYAAPHTQSVQSRQVSLQ